MSALDQFRAVPGMFNPAWIGKDPADDDVAREFLFHDCPLDVVEWALTTRIHLTAAAALAEVCPLDAWPKTPRSYIVCTEDRTLSPEWSRRVARERLDIEPIEMPAGHCPHVSRPAALAEELVKIAAGRQLRDSRTAS
jgi:pimeloyl-ACP methyl ester carboxylesterase